MMTSADATSEGRFSRSRRLEGYVNVVITLKEETSLQEFIDRLSFFGATLTVTFRRTHALAVTMPEELVGLLELDSQVKSIEDDAPFTSFSETVPWGITSIQGHDSSIPPPVNTGTCFGICVIDTGLQVSHPDIVSFIFFISSAIRKFLTRLDFLSPAFHCRTAQHSRGGVQSESGRAMVPTRAGCFAWNTRCGASTELET
jgi:hypothetical protein